MLYYTILYYTILYYTILYYTILYYTTLYYTILYYTILYYTILYYTVLYCTILYYTTLNYSILYYTTLYYSIRYYTINSCAFTTGVSWNQTSLATAAGAALQRKHFKQQSAPSRNLPNMKQGFKASRRLCSNYTYLCLDVTVCLPVCIPIHPSTCLSGHLCICQPFH